MPSRKLPSLFVDLVTHIDQALTKYSRFGEGCPPRLAAAIAHSLLAPGKRLRPLLVLLSAQACGSHREAAMPAACAVEMVHTYSLVHDDLPAMDDDDLRRGQPSCHAEFGEATAILAGDALLTRAFEILSSDVHPPQVAVACCRELARAAGATAMVGGQADDLDAQADAGDVAVLESIHRRKTGAMLEVSLRLGALVGQGDDDQLRALTAFGTNLGLAFQIVDDLLDQVGEETKVGKRIGKDVQAGKLTFPSLLGVEPSRRRAEWLTRQACDAVGMFGEKAAPLKVLAQFVLDRRA